MKLCALRALLHVQRPGSLFFSKPPHTGMFKRSHIRRRMPDGINRHFPRSLCLFICARRTSKPLAFWVARALKGLWRLSSPPMFKILIADWALLSLPHIADIQWDLLFCILLALSMIEEDKKKMVKCCLSGFETTNFRQQGRRFHQRNRQVQAFPKLSSTHTSVTIRQLTNHKVHSFYR